MPPTKRRHLSRARARSSLDCLQSLEATGAEKVQVGNSNKGSQDDPQTKTGENEELRSKNDALTEEIGELKQQIDAYTRELGEAWGEVGYREQELDEYKANQREKMTKKTQELRKAEAKVTELINKRQETELLLKEKSKKYRQLKRGLRAVAEEAEEVIDRKDRKIRKLTATIHNQTQTISRQRQTIGKQKTMIQRLQKKNKHQQQQRPQPDQVPPSPSRPVTRPKSTNSKNPPVPKASLHQEATLKDITDDETSTDEMPIPQPKTYAAKLEEQWLATYNQLKDYKTKFGDCNVPRDCEDNKALGRWVNSQRKKCKEGKLSEGRWEMLEAIGFEVRIGRGKNTTKSNDTWNIRYNELKEYKEQNDHCMVPQNYEHNKQLGRWVNHQREYHRNGRLSNERISALEKLGFVWNAKPKLGFVWNAWDVRYNELKEYKEQNDHCMVPQNYEHNKQLGRWVNTQREYYRNGRLSNERISALEKLGFVWHNESWNIRYKELIEFKDKFGHCIVPRHCKDNKQLGTWVHHQREAYKKGMLSKAQVTKLEEIGFIWHVRRSPRGRNVENASTCPSLPLLDDGVDETIEEQGDNGVVAV